MEKLIEKFLMHLDLNKDGKPDVDELHDFMEKVLPPVKRFVENGGLTALRMALSPVLSREALAALDELIALVPKV